MKHSNESDLENSALRQQAEDIRNISPRRIAEATPENALALLHELEVHQIELELQNENLRILQMNLTAIKDKYQKLYETAPAGYLTLSENTTILELNLTAVSLLGYTKDELITKRITGIIFNEDQDIFYFHRKNLLETRVKQECSLRFKKSDGELVWVKIISDLSEDTETEGTIKCILIDITKEYNLTSELKENEKSLRLAQHLSHIGSWYFDLASGSFKWSEELYRIFGLRPDTPAPNPEQIGRMLTKESRIRFYETIKQLQTNFTPLHIELNLLLNNAEEKVILVNANCIYDITGAIAAYDGTVQDITNEVKTRNEIIAKNKLLEKLNAEKDRFFSILAHDLRSPFHTLLGYFDLFSEDTEILTHQEMISFGLKMKLVVEKLYKLLINLLDWAKLQRGLMSCDPQDLVLQEITNSIIAEAGPSAEKKSITIVNNIDRNVVIWADINMMKGLLRNLITNAIKFTEKSGNIVLNCSLQENNFYRVSIEDTGIGMTPEMISKLFSIEHSVGRKGTEGELSTGIGLLLCKEFAEKQKGKIWAESTVGKGSTFHFTVPGRGYLSGIN